MGKGPGPSALEQLFVVNNSETESQPFKSTLTRFNIKTHTATTPIERSYLRSITDWRSGTPVAVYKGKVYVANSGGSNLSEDAGSTVEVFNANTLELEQTWKTSQLAPVAVAAYKDNIYVTCAVKREGEEGINGNAVDVFPIDRQENKDGPGKSWQTSQFFPFGVAAYEDKIYVTCGIDSQEGDESPGYAVDVFPVDADNNSKPEKSWVTSQFGPVGVAAYEENIYVTCSRKEDNLPGNAVDVFPVDADNNSSPEKSWVTSQLGPSGVAAYEKNIYVTCLRASDEEPGNQVDVFHVDTGHTEGPGKSWVTSQLAPVDVAAYEENIYVTCPIAPGFKDGNQVNIFPVDAETGAVPSEIWTTDYGPGGIAAYNSLHPEGNLYIDSSGSNVV